MFGFCDKHTWPQNMKHQHHGSSHAEAGKSLSNTVCKYNKQNAHKKRTINKRNDMKVYFPMTSSCVK